MMAFGRVMAGIACGVAIAFVLWVLENYVTLTAGYPEIFDHGVLSFVIAVIVFGTVGRLAIPISKGARPVLPLSRWQGSMLVVLFAAMLVHSCERGWSPPTMMENERYYVVYKNGRAPITESRARELRDEGIRSSSGGWLFVGASAVLVFYRLSRRSRPVLPGAHTLSSFDRSA